MDEDVYMVMTKDLGLLFIGTVQQIDGCAGIAIDCTAEDLKIWADHDGYLLFKQI